MAAEVLLPRFLREVPARNGDATGQNRKSASPYEEQSAGNGADCSMTPSILADSTSGLDFHLKMKIVRLSAPYRCLLHGEICSAHHDLPSATGLSSAWIPGVESSISLRQAGQYQGAGVFTGLGLRLRHLAQRKRLPFTAVLGRDFFQSWECSSSSVTAVLHHRVQPQCAAAHSCQLPTRGSASLTHHARR